MSTKENILYLKDIKGRLLKEMPKVREEIRIYEEKRDNGQLTENPVPGPQFND